MSPMTSVETYQVYFDTYRTYTQERLMAGPAKFLRTFELMTMVHGSHNAPLSTLKLLAEMEGRF